MEPVTTTGTSVTATVIALVDITVTNHLEVAMA
jgi:hypothetical protein